jgi:hypothetical protein
VTEQTQEAVGEEFMEKVASLLTNEDKFDDFLASEIDLFGVQSDLDEIGVARVVLGSLESSLA